MFRINLSDIHEYIGGDATHDFQAREEAAFFFLVRTCRVDLAFRSAPARIYD